MAVLKGLRKLREIALSQLLSVILVLLVSVPIFYFFRLRGLVLSLVLVSFATMVITLMFSVRQVPYRVGMLDREVLGRGAEMVRLGVFFTIAAFLGSGAFSVVANFLMTHGGAEAVGAYSAGYALVTYLGVFVFSAMESDYFPRISTAIENRDDARVQLKQQIEISVLLMTPLITLFLLFLEPIVRLLLTEKFCTAVPMAQIAVLSLFFKAVSQPLAYISLAKGDSNVYLIQEACYDVALVALVIPCFNCGGLRMVGLAFTVAEIVGLLVNAVVARCRYDMKLSGDSVKLLLVLPWAVIVAFAAVSASSGWLRWTVGSVACIISMLVSYKGLKNRTSFIDSFRQKIREKLGK